MVPSCEIHLHHHTTLVPHTHLTDLQRYDTLIEPHTIEDTELDHSELDTGNVYNQTVRESHSVELEPHHHEYIDPLFNMPTSTTWDRSAIIIAPLALMVCTDINELCKLYSE